MPDHEQPSRLTQEILGLADDMRDCGVLSGTAHRTLTKPLLDRTGLCREPELTLGDVRRIVAASRASGTTELSVADVLKEAKQDWLTQRRSDP